MKAAAVILVLLAWPSSAAAHTLTLPGAKRVALAYAERVAASVVPIPRRVSVRDCERRTRHVVDCAAFLRFAGGTMCQRTVRVRFVSRDSGRVARSFVGVLDCY